jgi:Asp-tRNA(Asn)/Glu-tRNA(Gln) amidotransferase A subunit family amidase
MAQPDALDRKSATFPSPLVKADLSLQKPEGKKYIGIYRPWISRSDPAVVSLFDKAISHYSTECGYEVIDITLPYLPQGQKAHALTILSEVRSAVTPTQINQLTYANQLLLNIVGSHATCQDFLAAQKLRELLMAHLAWLWEQYPGMVVVTPTTPCAGWKVGAPSDVVKGGRGVSDGDMSLKSMEYVFVANWTGCPAISCPMGFVDGDVPVGIMVCIEEGVCFRDNI